MTITGLNGKMPEALLVNVTPAERLRWDAATSYERARAMGMPSGVTDAYRTLQEQQDRYNDYLNGGNYALPPGSSEHGEGAALDLPTGPREWMAAHPEHGWRRTNPAESWHFEYDPHRDQAPTPPPPTQEDDDMGNYFPGFVCKYPVGNLVFVLSHDLATKRHVHGDAELRILEATGYVRNDGFSQATIDKAVWVPCHKVDGSPV